MHVRLSLMSNPKRDDMFNLKNYSDEFSNFFAEDFDIFKFRNNV